MKLSTLTAALVAAGMCSAALAAPGDAAMLEKLQARLDKLEARNAELEKEVRALKSDNEKIVQGLGSDRISENEPELTARLKAVEKDALESRKAAKKIDALDGVTAGVSFTTVAQKASGLPTGTSGGDSHLGYRADVTVELPLEPMGDIEHKLFGHFRTGQGNGLNNALSGLGAFAGAPNAVAFRASGSVDDDSVPVLGQAWYQAVIPLPYGGFKPNSYQNLEVTFGKMDIFGFFDQNGIAGDEAKQFLNSVFVHNPLLDAGGQVGVDANGFQPGLILAYANAQEKSEPWRLSLGVFGSNGNDGGRSGANYGRGFSAPLVIAQAEKQLRLFGGLAGNYRLYAWRQGQAADLGSGQQTHHVGWGASVDQRVNDGVTLFGRYGHLVKGNAPFDRALTLGAEFNGSYWNRGGDAIGAAAGWLRSSKAYRANPPGDVLGNDDPSDSSSFADNIANPSGAEQVAEFYYRYRLNANVELSPDFQIIRRLGANPEAKTVRVFGVRAQVNF